jgi:hypothetical protein
VFLKIIIRAERRRSSTWLRSPTMKLDADENELLDDVERGEWKSPRVADASAPGTPVTRRPRSASIDG